MNADHRAPWDATVRVLVVDNSRIFTRLLSDALRRDPLLQVVAFESDSSDLMATAVAENIDVLLISSNLDDQPSRGLDIVRQLWKSHPSIRSVLLPDSSKDEVVLQAFRAGARGIFSRNEATELLAQCVKCVHRGEIWATSRHFDIVISALANSPELRAVDAQGMNLLSERELEVVGCLAEGLTNREIAERLQISRHTVKNYFFRIFDKLGVSSRVELLFMSLSHAPILPSAARASSHNDGNKGGYSSSELDLLRKSAEAGVPAAQLALAQLYLNRRSAPNDLVDAYTWYLVATESARQAHGFVTNMLTLEQIEQAKAKASLLLAKRKQPPGSIPPTEQIEHSAPGVYKRPIDGIAKSSAMVINNGADQPRSTSVSVGPKLRPRKA